MHAANFVSFLHKISYLSGIEAPVKKNQYLEDLVLISLPSADTINEEATTTTQCRLFGSDGESLVTILNFLYEASMIGSLMHTSSYSVQKRNTQHLKIIKTSVLMRIILRGIVKIYPQENVVSIQFQAVMRGACSQKRIYLKQTWND